MASKSQDAHSELVRQLEDRVKKNYSITMTEVNVRDPQTGGVIGEIDLIGIVGDQWDVYEVKVNDKFSKACKQLERLKQYLSDCGNLNLYYYSGRDDKIVRVG